MSSTTASAPAAACSGGAALSPPPPLDLPPEALAPAQLIWSYMRLGHEVHFPPIPLQRDSGGEWPADAIIALGSNDLRVAERAAQLYLAGYGTRLVLSGGVGALTLGLYGGDSEAEAMAKVAEALGVPRSAMLLEGASTNTGENIRLSYQLLLQDSQHWQRYPQLQRIVLVQKPFMERRTWATFQAQWPAAPLPLALVTSPQLSFEEYAGAAPPGTPGLCARDILTTMMGDLQRIAAYPALGYQVHQHIPQGVWEALQGLVRGGLSSPQLMLVEGASRGSRELEDYVGLGSPHPPPPPPQPASATAE